MGLSVESGSKLFVDTAPLIYLIEGEGARADKVARLLDECILKSVPWVTSLITYMELLVLPIRKRQTSLAGKYRDLLTNSDHISLHPLNLAIADAAVELRAAHGIKVPDAVQLATAKVSGADWILTNDRDWRGVTSVPIVRVDDL